MPTTSQTAVRRVTDQLEKPSLDDRQYRVVRLSNDLEVLLVHDPDTDKASAALDVNVGSFSDEDDMPGMAHAVEHLLFMGTKKFPVENEYSQYLANNSGKSNAYTAWTSTNYYFEVAAKPANDKEPTEDNPSPFYGALDRFCQFFIEPLFLANTLDRELRAVDSENKKNLQVDAWRLNQLDKTLSNPKHPYCHFSTGNLDVLKIEPEAKGVNVREKFIEFHAKHYSANRMKLAILGREPLDVLERWVVELFTDIPNKNLPQNRWEDEVPFRENELGVQIFAKPVMDKQELRLQFPALDEDDYYDSQPSRYISHLVGHEARGSVLSYLKQKGWATSLSAGAYSICPGSPGLFNVQIRLTKEGLKHYTEITKIFFQYISLLRDHEPQEWIYEEQKRIADVDFKYQQKSPASSFTSNISAEMQKPLDRKHLLSSHCLRKYDPVLIKESLAMITPENLRMTVISRDFPGNWNMKEKWYETEYRHEKIPADLVAGLKEAIALPPAKRLASLHLPYKNDFIPTNFDVEKKEVPEPSKIPRLLRNDDEARIWWKKDDTFWVPRANLIVHLKTPVVFSSAANSVKTRLLTELIEDALEEYSYDASLAGLQYDVSHGMDGLFLRINGYNDKLIVLLEQVVKTMRDLEIKQDRFDIAKERVSRNYENWALQSSYVQIGNYMELLNLERTYLVEELAAEIAGVTLDQLKEFHHEVLSKAHTEALVHGNLYKSSAISAIELIQRVLKPQPLPRSELPTSRACILPPGANYVYKKILKDPKNVNHCIENWYYVADRSDQLSRAKQLLFSQMFHEPAFNQLRTKEQLGYIVWSGMRRFPTTAGLRVLIQGERSPDYLDGRIEACLADFGKTLDAMTADEFEGHKRSLIVERLEKVKNLGQESSRIWSYIQNGYYEFEQVNIDADNVKSLTKADMQAFFAQYLDPASKTRARLSVYLYARGATELDSKVEALLHELELRDSSQENRKSITSLESYLKAGAKIAEDAMESLVAQAKKLGLKQAVESSDLEIDTTMASAVEAAVEIKDVAEWKASLKVSDAPRPSKDLNEYADNDAKL